MKPETEGFFIGWAERLPAAQATFVRRLLIGLGVLSIVVAFGLVVSQRGFADSVFEFGEQRTLEGRLLTDPVPMLKVLKPNSSPLEPQFERVLLVGFGKKGAEPALQTIQDQHGPLADKIIRLQGTLIYHEGKKALELTDEEASFMGWGDPATVIPDPSYRELGRHRLSGEILDPKCALGVMKPGFGKPHRSCAIRCLSGGIPAVFRIRYPDGEGRYLLITGPDGEPVNEALLPYTGEPVRVCGDLAQVDDWQVLRLEPRTDILRLPYELGSAPLPMCQN